MARDLSNIQPEVHSRRRYYVVSEGTKPGVYYEWEDVEAQTKKYSCPLYCRYRTEIEAREAHGVYQRRQAKPKIKQRSSRRRTTVLGA
ncbi:MAG: hypothetical protein CL589_17180 [Alteromonadaceae bacterium]|nr:hypothetical protein [Alteromonadaceae bacterium]MAX44342.1 hypothetical protein [Alteromonadaceae bacterium]|tara:strand:+ start:288 stop:551 length:264 start_codon:yes stop_codon:yes gene_type:complete